MTSQQFSEEQTRDGDRLCAMPATELAAAIRSKEVSPVEVTEAVLDRVERVNPQVNAVVTLTDELARTSAKAAEQAVMRGDELGPLHGVPYTLKDLTPTKGIRTTMGSKLFEDWVPEFDTLVGERLRDAGGVLIGKTNTPDEGCKGVTDNMVFGITRNPWNLDRTPGGSSGGASAAVAAGMAPLAEGSDFAGSIRIPASFAGLVGLKPTDGRIAIVPNNMIWHPIAFCYGPITRTVADAALMLQVLAGYDDRDPRSLADEPADYGAAVSGDLSLQGTKIGWLGNLGFAAVEPVVTDGCRGALRVFEELGCSVEDDTSDFSDCVEPYTLLNSNRRSALMDPYYPDRKDEMDPLLAWRTEFAYTKTSTEAVQASMVQTDIFHRVHALLERYDVLMLPTTPTVAFPIGVDYPPEIAGTKINSPFEQLPLTFLFNMTGHPAISVPAGWTEEGLPVGLQIVGRWRADAEVLRVAAAFEQASPWAHRWPALVSGAA